MRMNLFAKWNLDALGIGASLICAVHCALLPLLVTALPLLGLELMENDLLEFSIMGLSLLIGYTALYRGYYRHHRLILPILLFTAGFSTLLAGHFLSPEGWEPYVIIFGAALIIFAHYLNLKGCKKCRTHKHNH